MLQYIFAASSWSSFVFYNIFLRVLNTYSKYIYSRKILDFISGLLRTLQPYNTDIKLSDLTGRLTTMIVRLRKLDHGMDHLQPFLGDDTRHRAADAAVLAVKSRTNVHICYISPTALVGQLQNPSEYISPKKNLIVVFTRSSQSTRWVGLEFSTKENSL